MPVRFVSGDFPDVAVGPETAVESLGDVPDYAS